jgi:NADH:ubiquinone oxidoreductase subunit E
MGDEGSCGDRDVTLRPVDCTFNCSVAPVVEVDGACHGRR